MIHHRLHDVGAFGELIITAIRRYPTRVAFIQDHGEVTYRDLGAQISRAIQLFDRLGLARGDTVAQLSGNRPEVFYIVAAAYIYGLRSVTLHPTAGAADHAYILQDCGAKLFIGESYFDERIAELKSRGSQVKFWFKHDASTASPSFWEAASEFSFRSLHARTAPDDVLRLAYTGGTTGRPKGVMLTDRSLLTNALLWLSGVGLPEGVRYLCPAPMSHGAGSLIVPTLLRGGAIILQRGFDVDRFLNGIDRHQAALTWLVPTMLYGLLDRLHERPRDLTSLQMLIYSAAAAAPARIRQALEVLGPVLVQSYGQTEAPNTILMLNQHDHLGGGDKRLNSAGKPYPGIRIALLDEQDRELPLGQVGEICVRGPLVMDGYWNQPEQTAEALRGGWLRTGDLAYCDEEGFYYIVDRKKDLIISGGFNIYPREVEDVLATHPDVAAAAVFGVPDEKWGEAVTATVIRRLNSSSTADDLVEFVRTHKGPVHAPKALFFVDQIPLTPLGKPDKKALRQRFTQRESLGAVTS